MKNSFSHPIELRRLPAVGESFTLIADAAQRAVLAERFDLESLDRLEATVRIATVPGGMYSLSASLSAAAVQRCVISLDPVPARIEESFTLLYGPGDEAAEIVLDGAAETVEPIEGGIIDIGEAVAQQLSLALDPFPRAPGATIADLDAAPEGGEAASPFAALAKLRKPADS